MQVILTISLYVVSLISSTAIAALLLVNSRRNRAAFFFALLTLAVTIWIALNFLTSLTAIYWKEFTLPVARLTLIGPAFIPLLTLLFSMQFQQKENIRPHPFLFIPAFILLLCTPTSLNLIDAQPASASAIIKPGYAYYFLLIYFAIFLYFTFRTLGKTFQQTNSSEVKSQIKLFYLGATTTLVLALFLAVVLPIFDMPQLSHLAPITSLAFIATCSYAILVHHFFDIKFVVARTLIYSGILSTVLAVYGGTLFLISNFIDAGDNTVLVTSTATALFLAFSFDPIHSFLSERTDTWLYKKEYEQQEVTKVLSEKLVTALGLEEGLDVVMRTLTETLHLDKAVTYVFQQGDLGKETVKRIQQIGHNSKASLSLSDKDFLVSFFTTHNHILSTRELERELEEEARLISNDRISKSTFRLSSEYLRQHAIKQSVLRKLKELDTAIAIPLHLSM